MPVMTEHEARRVAVLRKQAARHQDRADRIKALLAANPHATDLVPSATAAEGDAGLCLAAADMAERHARAHHALIEAHRAAVHAAVAAAIAEGRTSPAELRAALSINYEDACPAEYRAYRDADDEDKERAEEQRDALIAANQTSVIPALIEFNRRADDLLDVAREAAVARARDSSRPRNDDRS